MLAFQSVIARMPNPPSWWIATVLSSSPTARPLTSWVSVEVGQPLSRPIRVAEVGRLLDRAIATSQTQHTEIVWNRQRIFSTDLIPVDQAGVALFMHDHTALKRMDVLKSDLITIVSHDLRNPLGVAMGFAEILAEEPGLSAEVRTCVDGIRSSLEKMLRADPRRARPGAR